MRPGLITTACAGIVFGLLSFVAPQSRAAGLKLQAQLLWGTDDIKPPPGKNYKPVDSQLHKRLKDLPLKWSHYFEVNRKEFPVEEQRTRRVAISDKCQIEVKNLGDSNIEVVLFGKGKEVMRRRQALPRGEILALGGNAPNATAWLVVIRRVQ